MTLRDLKKRLGFFLRTPLHPQWISLQAKRKLRVRLAAIGPSKTVLDVGCFDKWAKDCLPEDTRYIGLDHWHTATRWYDSIPDLYADAAALPIGSGRADVVLLLDVLEHVRDVHRLVKEIYRVLAPGGQLLIQVPFLYPLHDQPRDFQRLTRHGLEALLTRHGFHLSQCAAIGHPLETAAMLGNIALAKTLHDWIRRRHPAALLAVFVPVAVVAANLLASALARIGPSDAFMPFAYQIVAGKRPSSTDGALK